MDSKSHRQDGGFFNKPNLKSLHHELRVSVARKELLRQYQSMTGSELKTAGLKDEITALAIVEEEKLLKKLCHATGPCMCPGSINLMEEGLKHIHHDVGQYLIDLCRQYESVTKFVLSDIKYQQYVLTKLIDSLKPSVAESYLMGGFLGY